MTLRKVCTFSGAEEWAARKQLNEIVCAAHLLLSLCAPVISSVKGSKISIREKYTVVNIKDLEGCSKNPTFKMSGTTHNLYIVDSCIICVKDCGKQ